MNQLYTREGSTHFLRVCRDDKGRRIGVVKASCARCGGAGRSDKWAFTGFTCFDCNGAGHRGERFVRLYTAAEIEALNARREKARAKAQAKAQAVAQERAAQQEAARLERRSVVEASDLYCDIKAYAHRSDFIAKILASLLVADLSERQIEAVREACARLAKQDAEAAASRHIGAVGERISFSGVVERVHCVRRSTSWQTGLVFVTIRTDDGAVLSWKAGRYPDADVGQRVRGTASVKAHSDFRGVKQTEIKNPRFHERMDA